jgi:hypothetical protein
MYKPLIAMRAADTASVRHRSAAVIGRSPLAIRPLGSPVHRLHHLSAAAAHRLPRDIIPWSMRPMPWPGAVCNPFSVSASAGTTSAAKAASTGKGQHASGSHVTPHWLVV